MFKGGILNSWGKKMAVALDSPFFNTLPKFKTVPKDKADVAWLIYDLVAAQNGAYKIAKTQTVYTKFSEALHTISRPKIGRIDDFLKILQSKVDEKLESPPVNQTIENPFDS